MEDPAKPACGTCSDEGHVDDLPGETGIANCPDCNPAPEHAGTNTTEYRQWADSIVAGSREQMPEDAR